VIQGVNNASMIDGAKLSSWISANGPAHSISLLLKTVASYRSLVFIKKQFKIFKIESKSTASFNITYNMNIVFGVIFFLGYVYFFILFATVTRREDINFKKIVFELFLKSIMH
jgi:hypothetical protein